MNKPFHRGVKLDAKIVDFQKLHQGVIWKLGMLEIWQKYLRHNQFLRIKYKYTLFHGFFIDQLWNHNT